MLALSTLAKRPRISKRPRIYHYIIVFSWAFNRIKAGRKELFLFSICHRPNQSSLCATKPSSVYSAENEKLQLSAGSFISWTKRQRAEDRREFKAVEKKLNESCFGFLGYRLRTIHLVLRFVHVLVYLRHEIQSSEVHQNQRNPGVERDVVSCLYERAR